MLYPGKCDKTEPIAPFTHRCSSRISKCPRRFVIVIKISRPVILLRSHHADKCPLRQRPAVGKIQKYGRTVLRQRQLFRDFIKHAVRKQHKQIHIHGFIHGSPVKSPVIGGLRLHTQAFQNQLFPAVFQAIQNFRRHHILILTEAGAQLNLNGLHALIRNLLLNQFSRKIIIDRILSVSFRKLPVKNRIGLSRQGIVDSNRLPSGSSLLNNANISPISVSVAIQRASFFVIPVQRHGIHSLKNASVRDFHIESRHPFASRINRLREIIDCPARIPIRQKPGNRIIFPCA